MTITKASLCNELYDQLGLSHVECKELIEEFFDTISDALARGEEVKLSGFGNFMLNDKNERPGRNPKTGETCLITARRVVTFRASGILKERLG